MEQSDVILVDPDRACACGSPLPPWQVYCPNCEGPQVGRETAEAFATRIAAIVADERMPQAVRPRDRLIAKKLGLQARDDAGQPALRRIPAARLKPYNDAQDCNHNGLQPAPAGIRKDHV